MPLNYRKRINLGGGAGLNVSRSGISTSVRTKHGSIGTRGFSLRTGIPGLSFRSSFGRAKGNEAIFILLAFLVLGALVVGALVVWNLVRFLTWVVQSAIDRIRRKPETSDAADANLGYVIKEPKEFIFSERSLPRNMLSMPVTLKALLVQEGENIEAGESVAEIEVAGITGKLPSSASGRISFFKSVGDRIELGDKIFVVS